MCELTDARAARVLGDPRGLAGLAAACALAEAALPEREPHPAVYESLAVLLDMLIVLDGEANWLEGAALIGLYGIIATSFWWG